MKAVVWTRYGPPDVLQLKEIEKPAPAKDEVLIRVHAATVTMGDCEVRSLRMPPGIALPIRLYAGWRRPRRIKILGQELAGQIEDTGSEVTRFQKGNAVFAATFFRFGAYAQYACLPESYVHLKPDAMTYEEAATLPTGGLNGVHFLRVAHIRSGESVLIYGAGGSIGTYVIQIAKALGAEVIAVDSGEKLDMLRSIGADHVIDYEQQDFTRIGKNYDVIIDVVGKSSFSGSIRALSPHGRYVLGNPRLPGMIRGLWVSRTSQKKVIFEPASYQAEDYALLMEMIEAGKIKPVINRRYPLEETAEAHRYVESGRKKGNVVIEMPIASSP